MFMQNVAIGEEVYYIFKYHVIENHKDFKCLRENMIKKKKSL